MLEIENLTKTFGNTEQSFLIFQMTLVSGKIYGLVGRNGFWKNNADESDCWFGHP